MKQVSWNEFIDKFDRTVHNKIIEARKRNGVLGIAGLRCQVLDSSRCGQLTALIYGTGCTYKSIENMDLPGGIYPTGLPSSASFVEFYTEDMPA